MELAFVKMHGLGNDFIVMDDLDEELELAAEAVEWFCDRNFGIGADGLILVRPFDHPRADFFMLYYNADGTRRRDVRQRRSAASRSTWSITAWFPRIRTASSWRRSAVSSPSPSRAPTTARCTWPPSTWANPILKPVEIPTEMRCGGNDDMVISCPLETELGTFDVTPRLDGQSALRPVGRRR